MNPNNYKNRTVNSRMTRILTFVVALVTCCLSANVSVGQVNFSNDFNLNATGWTGTITRTTATTACGTASMRRNMYASATTGTMISPSTGTSLGGLTTLTYKYKVANWSANTVGTSNWGSFDVQYGATAAGPWTTFQTINTGNHIVSGTCSTVVVTFTPPAGALFIKWDAFWTSGDYYINFDDVSVTESLGACGGLPAGGTTASSTPNACSGTNFTLSVTGDANPLLTGLTYQWQSADDAGFTINVLNLGTAQTQITSQTTAKHYRRQITCTNGGQSSFSSVLSVGMNPLLACYCASSHSSGCSGDAIVSATLSTLNNNTGATCPAAPAYTYYFPGVSQTTLYQGSAYSLVLTFGSDGSQYAGAWIDYDNNGTLDAGENIGLTGNAGANGSATINFTVPVTSTPSLTRLRIVGGNDAAVLATQACGASSSTWGETEDYDITISLPPPCSGSPTIGTANASASNVCPGGTTTLSVSGVGPETGYTYQWYDGSFIAIPGATTNPYVATPTANETYYCVVTCSNGGGSTPTLPGVPVTFDASANAGTISGPTSGTTYTNLAYSTNTYVGNLQWQSATALAGPYTDVPAATLDNVTLVSNAGGTFYVRLRAASPTCTTYSNVITVVVSVAGDNVCSAIPISTGNSGPYTNIGATGEAGEVAPPLTGCNLQTGWCAGGNTVVNSVWFSFTAPPSGRVSIRLNPNFVRWDSQFALYTATSCSNFGSFTLIAANDDSASSPFNSYIAPKCLIPGATYYLQVDGYQATTNGNWGILLTEEPTVLPTGSISGDAEICAGGNTNLTLNFTGTAPWTYSINGGAPQVTSNNPETVNVAPGSTTVYTLTSLGDNSCPGGSGILSGSATVTVTSAPPANSVTMTSIPVDACVGSNVVITTNSVIGATGYTWAVPTGTLVNGQVGPVTTTVPNATITLGPVPANSSGWEICVFASNACGVTNNHCRPIRGVLSAPAPIAGANVACPNTNGNYSTLAVGGASGYVWTVTGDASVVGSGTSATVTFGPAFTSGSLCVRATLACGYQGPQRCLSITNSVGTIGVMSGTFTVCPGTNGVAYSVPVVANATTYTWTVPSGATIATGSGTNAITVNFGPSYTVGNVCVTATSSCGVVSAARCKTVASNKAGTPGNFTSGATSGVCGQTITYSVNTVAGATGYTWTAPAGASLVTANGTNTIDIAFGPGYTTGNVCVTADNGCGSSAPRCVLVKGTPANPGVITGSNSVCALDAGVPYSIAPVFGATGYVWTLPTGATFVSGQGSNSIIIDYGTNGGTIGVTATGTCGNSGTRTLAVAMTCRVSSSNLPGASVNAYPNPVSTQLNLELNAVTGGTYTVELMDLAGRVIYSNVLSATEGINNSVIDVATYAKGVYTMRVKNSDGFAKQIRIVVE